MSETTKMVKVTNEMMNRGADEYRELTHKLATSRSIQYIVARIFSVMMDARPQSPPAEAGETKRIAKLVDLLRDRVHCDTGCVGRCKTCPYDLARDAANEIEEFVRALASANAAQEEVERERDDGEDNMEHVRRILRGVVPDKSPAFAARIENALAYIEQIPRTAYYREEREALILAADNNLSRAESAESRLKAVEQERDGEQVRATQWFEAAEAMLSELRLDYVPGALGIIEAPKAIRKLRARLKAVEAALRTIERWGPFPATGRYWDKGSEHKREMSYSAAFGSNGERDYMRSVARAALLPAPHTEGKKE